MKDIEKDVPNDIDEQSQEFLKKYDDTNFRLVVSIMLVDVYEISYIL